MTPEMPLMMRLSVRVAAWAHCPNSPPSMISTASLALSIWRCTAAQTWAGEMPPLAAGASGAKLRWAIWSRALARQA